MNLSLSKQQSIFNMLPPFKSYLQIPSQAGTFVPRVRLIKNDRRHINCWRA